MRLGSSVAVAVVKAGSYSCNSTPSLGTSICCGHGPKKKKEGDTGEEQDAGKAVDHEFSLVQFVRSVSTSTWRC